MSKNKIRSLKPGEPIPAGSPGRYRSSEGYIRLRWWLSPTESVEVYEHRVVDGRVTDAPHVHHLNGVKDDNRPDNLIALTPAEHRRHHRSIDRAELIDLYEGGMSTAAIERTLGINRGNVSKMLRSEGVEMRPRRQVTRQWCPGSHADAPCKVAAPCPSCGRELAIVGRDVHAGWGRLRFPRHLGMDAAEALVEDPIDTEADIARVIAESREQLELHAAAAVGIENVDVAGGRL